MQATAASTFHLFEQFAGVYPPVWAVCRCLPTCLGSLPVFTHLSGQFAGVYPPVWAVCRCLPTCLGSLPVLEETLVLQARVWAEPQATRLIFLPWWEEPETRSGHCKRHTDPWRESLAGQTEGGRTRRSRGPGGPWPM